jgi:two-component system cell cycle sensor histidine kinase/response regulator CckA
LTQQRLEDSAPQWATILLVDSDSPSREIFKKVLERAGYRVVDAYDGAQGLHLLHNCGTPISLLITEITMPGMDGLTLASLVQAEQPGIETLYVTAYVEDYLVPRLRRGMRILPKPFLPEVLLAQVRELLTGPKLTPAGVRRERAALP